MAESLLRFGIVNNIQVWFDENGDCYCFDAHHRRKAFEVLSRIGLEIPLLPATRCLAPSKVEAMRLLLVKESKSSWVNYKVVPDYLQETGFSFKVASRVIDLPEIKWNELCEANEESEEDRQKADEIPEPPPEVHIKTGDLIELGAHRLLCGDSTSTKDVKKLLNGVKWDCLVFDPPFEVADFYAKIPKYNKGQKLVVFWDYRKFGLASFGAISKGWTAQFEFIWDRIISWPNTNRPLARHKACGVFCEDPFFNTEKAIIYDGKKRKAHKVTNARGTLDYKPLDGAKHISTVEIFQNVRAEADHPYVKPMGWIQAIYNGLDSKVFFDMFGGSGSTLIYAEKNDKRSFTMELEPNFCQVIVQRWVDFTGQDEIKINGKVHDWRELRGE